MVNMNILYILEEELNRMKESTRYTSTLKLDPSMLYTHQKEYSDFNQSYYYKPAEIAIMKNTQGIKSFGENDFCSSEKFFNEALTYFKHPAFYVNLAIFFQHHSKKFTLPIEFNNEHTTLLINTAFNLGMFINPCYISIDQSDFNYSSSPLHGYDYAYELISPTFNEQTSVLILNIPFIVWKEFYTLFLNNYMNPTKKYKITKLKDDSQMFLWEVRNREDFITGNMHEGITIFPLLKIELPSLEKPEFLNSFKNFILEFYLKNYNQEYFEINDSSEYWYFQAQKDNEKIYGMLKSAIHNIKNKVDNPFLNTNQREYLKGILEYRSFYPVAIPLESDLQEYISHILQEHILETVSNQDFKENLSTLLHSALKAINYDPNSIPTYLRKSIETTFKYIIFKKEHKVKKDFNLSIAMKKYSKPLPLQNNLSEFFLDIVSIEDLQIISRQNLEKNSYDKTLEEINRMANKKIHFDWNQKEVSMKAISQKEAINFFLKTVYSLEVLIKAYKL